MSERNFDETPPTPAETSAYWHERLLHYSNHHKYMSSAMLQLAATLTTEENIGSEQGQVRPQPNLGPSDLFVYLHVDSGYDFREVLEVTGLMENEGLALKNGG